jgi:23S rRNA (adenine2503-C2)-methyltransferase
VRHPEHHIFHFSPETLRAWCEDRAMPGYRADQILEWVYRKNTADPALMSNLGKRDRDLLAHDMTFLSGEVVAHRRASDGTQKLLVEWGEGTERHDTALPVLNASAPGASGRQTECVMIPVEAGEAADDDEGAPGRSTSARRTACISSQVGCPVGCRFCASGLGGLDGNLSAGRIVEQVWRLQQLPGVWRISNVVFMGMGEPLSNFSAVKHAVQTLAAPWGMGISARKITISTVGLPQAIEKLSEQLDLPVTLALSLHAPTDELRRTLIPWSNYTTIAELIAACDAWFRKTGREITLEYILLGGVNDRAEHARELAKVARRLRSNVNLIRYNEVKGLPFARPKTEDVRTFQSILRESNVNAHIRASRGRDIEAACGQLRHEAAASA